MRRHNSCIIVPYVLRRNKGDDSCDGIIHVLSNVPYGNYYVLRRINGDNSYDGIVKSVV